MPEVQNGNGKNRRTNNLEGNIRQTSWNKAIRTLNKILIGVLQVMYQGGVSADFKIHPTIVSYYVVAIVIYSFACICCSVQILPYSVAHLFLPILRPITHLIGTLATTLLVMTIVPIFGWLLLFIWVMWCVKVAWAIYAEIYAVICHAIVGALSLLSNFLPTMIRLPL